MSEFELLSGTEAMLTASGNRNSAAFGAVGSGPYLA
jgi:hypothetical protein